VTRAGTGTPSVTVAICTRNRAALLAQAIESVVDQLESSEAELLVVDNGSTDGTAKVVEAAARGRTDVFYLLEEVPGLSRARNAALQWSKAPVVAFLDDDAVADPEWLAGAREAFDDPRVDAAGGPVRLMFSQAAPPWRAVPSHATSKLGALDLGASARDLEPPQGPYGCNMAVRTSSALRLGGFDPRLGHSANRLGAAEETELFVRLHAAGGHVRWVPSMGIGHLVPTGRTTLRYLMRRGFAVGRGQAAADLTQQPLPLPSRLRRSASSARAALGAVPRHRRGGDSPRGSWRLAWCELTIHLGRAVQLAARPRV
jgi:glycosyltransferase involved in cell wall biosynthesis